MFDLGATFKELARELTDLVGLVEKNLASFDRIAAKYRRKRIARRLDEILSRMVRWRGSQRHILMMLEKRVEAAEPGDLSWVLRNEPEYRQEEMKEYAESVLATRDLLDEFQRDIVFADYALYEQIQDALDGRIKLIDALTDGEGSLSTEKLRDMHLAYKELLSAVEQLKKSLQKASRSVSAGKSVAAKTPPRKKASDKAGQP